jgi:ankyrin repeat protein
LQLFQTVKEGDLSKVQHYLDKGADVNAKDYKDLTPLMSASERGHGDIARLLVDRGADVSAKNTRSMTALMYASRGGHVDIAKLLVDRGADVNAKDSAGKTCLMIAAEAGILGPWRTAINKAEQRELVSLLIDRAADVNAQDPYGNTAWMYALSASDEERRNELAVFLIDRSTPVLPGVATLVIHQHVSLDEVDGHPVEKSSDVNNRLYLHLEPGFHDFRVSFSAPGPVLSTDVVGKPLLLKFNAKSGSVYAINYDYHLKNGKWAAWIEQYK